MLFLLLAIASSAGMALIFKHSEGSDTNRYALTSANYFTAVLVSGALLLLQGDVWAEPASPASLYQQLGDVFFSQDRRLTEPASITWSLVLGIPSGLLLFLGLLFYQISVRAAGVSLAGAFAKLGILAPMLLSLLLWRETPSALQWTGIALALSAVALISWPQKGIQAGHIRPLLALFCSAGLADFTTKLFQKVGVDNHKSLFLIAAFGSALLLSLIPLFAARKAITRRDLLLGVAVGVPNLCSYYFLIMALQHFPAVVTFPVFSAGVIVAIFLGGTFLFGEKLNRKETVALALILPALVFMNL